MNIIRKSNVSPFSPSSLSCRCQSYYIKSHNVHVISARTVDCNLHEGTFIAVRDSRIYRTGKGNNCEFIASARSIMKANNARKSYSYKQSYLNVPFPEINISRLNVCVCTSLTGQKFVDFILFHLQPAR